VNPTTYYKWLLLEICKQVAFFTVFRDCYLYFASVTPSQDLTSLFVTFFIQGSNRTNHHLHEHRYSETERGKNETHYVQNTLTTQHPRYNIALVKLQLFATSE